MGGGKGGVDAVKVSSEAAGPCDEALVLAAQKLRVRAQQHGSGPPEAREGGGKVLRLFVLFNDGPPVQVLLGTRAADRFQ